MDLKAMTNEELFEALIPLNQYQAAPILLELARRVADGDWDALYF